MYIFSSPRCNGKRKADHELKVHGLESERFENISHLPSSSDAALENTSDDAYNYQCNLLDQGLLYMNFVDAVAEAQMEQISEQQRGAGKTVPLDLDLEHNNNYLKESRSWDITSQQLQSHQLSKC